MGRAIKHGGEGLGRPHAGKCAAARVGKMGGGFKIRVLTIEKDRHSQDRQFGGNVWDVGLAWELSDQAREARLEPVD